MKRRDVHRPSSLSLIFAEGNIESLMLLLLLQVVRS